MARCLLVGGFRCGSQKVLGEEFPRYLDRTDFRSCQMGARVKNRGVVTHLSAKDLARPKATDGIESRVWTPNTRAEVGLREPMSSPHGVPRVARVAFPRPDADPAKNLTLSWILDAPVRLRC